MDNWIKLGFLNESDCDFAIHYKQIGLYRAVLNNIIVYVGKATEINNGGFRKRLRDYTRESNSARDYPSGTMMNKHQSELVIEILPLDKSKSVIATMENEAILTMKPKWNEFDSNKLGCINI